MTAGACLPYRRGAVGLQFHRELPLDSPMSQLELWLEHDRDDVPGALGPDSVQRIRADAARWGAQVARQGGAVDHQPA